MSMSIGQKITPRGLLKFAMPSIFMMLILSLYTIVDGVFTSRFVGSNALSSLNIVLDYVLIVCFRMGIGGAALATGIGQMIPALVGTIYFIVSRRELHFSKFRILPKEVVKACYNGSSEMIGQLSNAIVTFLFNIILIRLVGEHGVAAITILLYGQFLFNAFNMGFSIGISPIIGYRYGAKQKEDLRKIYKISMLFAINFLFSGFNILSSGFFTALSNGKASAILSFSRTLGFLVVSLLVLPDIFGVTGAWMAVPIAEVCTFVLCLILHGKYFWKRGEKNYIV